jgi:hypothetical protein
MTAALLAASRAAADSVRGVAHAPTWALTNEQVTEALQTLQQARCGIEAIEAQLVQVAEERQIPKTAGAASTTAWLASTTRVAKPAAARTVKTARLCHDGPILDAWSLGLVSADQVRVMAEAIDKLPEWFGDEERHDAAVELVGHAQRFDLDDLKRLAARIVEVVDPDGAEEAIGDQLAAEEARAWDATRLSMRRRGDGTTRGDFVIPDAQADTFRAALEGLAAPRRKRFTANRHALGVDDVMALPHEQRLGLAFLELIEHLDIDHLPQAGGLAATVAITVPLDAMRTGRGYGTSSGGSDVSAAQAQRMACNARIAALYLGADGRVVGTASTGRLYTKAQRLALAARDRGCIWAGRDRPPSHCEAHHLTPWSEGGATTLDNGVLLCFFHHHLLHEGHGWQLRRAADPDSAGIVEVIPPARVDPDRRPRRHARFTQLRPRAA